MTKVWEAEDSLDLKISAMLRPILPNFDGCTVRVKFWDGGSPMDGDEPLDNWNRKGTGEIGITILRPDKLDDDGPGYSVPVGDGLGYLGVVIRSLEQAEAHRGSGFVPFGWFCGHWISPKSLYELASESDVERVVRYGIEKGAIQTSREPEAGDSDSWVNQMLAPVKEIKLDRQHPWVKAALGLAPPVVSSFRPVQIKGEPLSETIIRDRR